MWGCQSKATLNLAQTLIMTVKWFEAALLLLTDSRSKLSAAFASPVKAQSTFMPAATNCASNSFFIMLMKTMLMALHLWHRLRNVAECAFNEANFRLHQAAAYSLPAIHCISYQKWLIVFTESFQWFPCASFLVTYSISRFALDYILCLHFPSLCFLIYIQPVVTLLLSLLHTSSPSPSSSPTSTDPGVAHSLSHSLTTSRAAAAAAVARGGRGLWLWLAMVVVLAGTLFIPRTGLKVANGRNVRFTVFLDYKAGLGAI